MSGWALWGSVIFGSWLAVSGLVGLLFARTSSIMQGPAHEPWMAAELPRQRSSPTGSPLPRTPTAPVQSSPRQRILLVDDDPSLRLLLRTTLMADEYALEEAALQRRRQISPASGALRWSCSTSPCPAGAAWPSAGS